MGRCHLQTWTTCADNRCQRLCRIGRCYLEIHTGEDKETDNLTPDIHCCFDFPESEADIRKLEERFSSLYNMPKNWMSLLWMK